jgi:hypothetical protein
MATPSREAALERLCAVRIPDEGAAACPPDEIFDAVQDLIDACGTDDIAEVVAGAVDAGRATLLQAITFLDVAVWSGTDNGTAMKLTTDEWVRRADDPVRLHIALHHETYPLPTAAQMKTRLTEIAARFPEHRAICERLIATRPADA